MVLTFLDPVCTSDCPLIAQDLRLADQMLGGVAARVELVAVVNNPLYTTTAVTAAFDRQEGLDRLANWTFLTGSLTQLHRVWNDYGVQTEVTPAGAMVAHSDIVYLIDKHGHTRVILNSDPGTGSAEGSSFVDQLASQIRHVARLVRPGPRRSHHLGTRWRLTAGTGSLALVAAASWPAVPRRPAPPRPRTRRGRAIPLASSTVAATTTWATLAMGHLDDPLNTFWQLLALTGGRPGSWPRRPGWPATAAWWWPLSRSRCWPGSDRPRTSASRPWPAAPTRGRAGTRASSRPAWPGCPTPWSRGPMSRWPCSAPVGGTVVVSTGDLSTWKAGDHAAGPGPGAGPLRLPGRRPHGGHSRR